MADEICICKRRDLHFLPGKYARYSATLYAAIIQEKRRNVLRAVRRTFVRKFGMKHAGNERSGDNDEKGEGTKVLKMTFRFGTGISRQRDCRINETKNIFREIVYPLAHPFLVTEIHVKDRHPRMIS